MAFSRVVIRAFTAIALSYLTFPQFGDLCAQGSQPESGSQTQPPEKTAAAIPTFHSTSTLVFLDVTVVDKKGHPVVTGLTKDDFSITENGKPQRIFSFEAPDAHVPADASPEDANPADANPEGSASRTILVLDFLNTGFDDVGYVRDQAQRFLESQPEELPAPAELLAVGNQSLDLLQGFTQNRQDLLFALQHMPAVLPYKLSHFDFLDERLRQSYIALQQIAIQNHGLPGRKNVLWLGNGGPSLRTKGADMAPSVYDKIQRYVHHTVNLMVEARISMYLIYPHLRMSAKSQPQSLPDGFQAQGLGNTFSTVGSSAGGNDPFERTDFTKFVYETGGKVFDENDVGREIHDALQLGSQYYTLTYQPHENEADSGFRRIRVAVRDSHLQIVTKAGFFGREQY